MAKWRVYMKPFADDSGTSYASEWEEVTDDVLALDNLNQSLDNTDYDVGVFRSSSMKVKLRNDHGLYGPVGELQSLFKFRRGGSKVKITWEPGDEPLYAGFFYCGLGNSIVSEEVDVFEGVLDDLATKSPIDEQTVEFYFLGYEAALEEMLVPYSSIANGDTFEEVIYAICNQAPLNTNVTVDVANISVGNSETIDDKTSLENETALDALRDILLVSNSVLYIENNVLYVKPRTAEANLSYTFYGPASFNGIENLLGIKDYRTGEQRLINFVTWEDTTLKSEASDSIQQYGYRKQEIGIDIVTDSNKRQNCLDSIRTEFQLPKREMKLSCVVSVDTIALFLLDRIAIDYPTEYFVEDGVPIAIYGIGEYGVDHYAQEMYRLTIEESARFKVMSRKIDFSKQTLELALREV